MQTVPAQRSCRATASGSVACTITCSGATSSQNAIAASAVGARSRSRCGPRSRCVSTASRRSAGSVREASTSSRRRDLRRAVGVGADHDEAARRRAVLGLGDQVGGGPVRIEVVERQHQHLARPGLEVDADAVPDEVLRGGDVRAARARRSRRPRASVSVPYAQAATAAVPDTRQISVAPPSARGGEHRRGDLARGRVDAARKHDPLDAGDPRRHRQHQRAGRVDRRPERHVAAGGARRRGTARRP